MRQRDCLGVDVACVVLVRFAVVFLMGAKHLEASLWTDNTLWASSFFFVFFFYIKTFAQAQHALFGFGSQSCWLLLWVLNTFTTALCFPCSHLHLSLSRYFCFCWIPCYLTHQAGPPIYFFSNICIHALNIKSLVPHVAVLVQGYPGHVMAFTLPLV